MCARTVVRIGRQLVSVRPVACSSLRQHIRGSAVAHIISFGCYSFAHHTRPQSERVDQVLMVLGALLSEGALAEPIQRHRALIISLKLTSERQLRAVSSRGCILHITSKYMPIRKSPRLNLAPTCSVVVKAKGWERERTTSKPPFREPCSEGITPW